MAMAELRNSHTGLEEEAAAAAAGVSYLTFLAQKKTIVMHAPFSKDKFKSVGIRGAANMRA